MITLSLMKKKAKKNKTQTNNIKIKLTSKMSYPHHTIKILTHFVNTYVHMYVLFIMYH